MAMSIRIALVAAAAASSAAVRMSGSIALTYEDFRSEFGVERDQAEHIRRAPLFERRRQEVNEHNQKPGIMWFAAMNRFADYTDEEFQGMLGHRLSRRALEAGAPPPVRATSLLQSESEQEAPLALAVDWRQKLNVSLPAKDQGSCGSCWAVAAAGAVETRLDMSRQGPDAASVSYEQLVDCVPNPKLCGGSGGCKGATAELAFDYMEKNPVARAEDYQGYQHGGDGKCKPPAELASRASRAVKVRSFVRLPENEPEDLRRAVARHGPVVVSADATGWSMYGSGVFNECDRDATINHAILLMGYGTEKKNDYWLIQNSWGHLWGEGGFIRVQRHSGKDKYCGVDHKPLDGVGCAGGPPTLPVCGMCGVVSDSAYPTGVRLA